MTATAFLRPHPDYPAVLVSADGTVWNPGRHGSYRRARCRGSSVLLRTTAGADLHWLLADPPVGGGTDPLAGANELRPVADAAGYWVSDAGHVCSEWGAGRHGRGGRLRVLRTCKDSAGYDSIRLRDGKGKVGMKCVRVHRLMLTAWRGARPEGCEARHKDGSKANRLTNLAWGTRRENVADCIRHGKLARGERHGAAKLTDEAVRVIRSEVGRGVSLASLARLYVVNPRTVAECATKRTWRHVIEL